MLRLVTLFTAVLTCTAQSGLALPKTGENHADGLFKPDEATQGKILQGNGKLPLSFEANQGQTDGPGMYHLAAKPQAGSGCQGDSSARIVRGCSGFIQSRRNQQSGQ